MTVQEFSFYSSDVQFETIQERGIFLFTLHAKKLRTYLFALDAFYVEVAQDRHNGQLWLIRGFDDPNQLEPYLSQIDISLLINP
ncbi:MAG TPA: hypothetical protein VD794_13980 [Flavisolibacter sp.]|nr:hypothetical protein [Flavisolibacter sp.]